MLSNMLKNMVSPLKPNTHMQVLTKHAKPIPVSGKSQAIKMFHKEAKAN
jgi:hypothetical protein